MARIYSQLTLPAKQIPGPISLNFLFRGKIKGYKRAKAGSYFQTVHLTLQPLVLCLQVSDAVFCLAQLSLQLSLQLTASLLELLQLLLSIMVTVETHTPKSDRLITQETLLWPKPSGTSYIQHFDYGNLNTV